MPIGLVCDHGAVGRIMRDLIAILQGKDVSKEISIFVKISFASKGGKGWLYDLMTFWFEEKRVVDKDILNSRKSGLSFANDKSG